MKLKRKINKEEFEGLNETQQSLYVEKDGAYILDIDDTAFETLKTEKKTAEDELQRYKNEEAERINKAEQRALAKAKEEYEKAKGDKDVEAIEKAWSDKYEKLEKSFNKLTEKHNSFVCETMVGKVVNDMANEISLSPKLMIPHIRNRLDVDMSGAEPKIVVKDENGKYSALTVDELKQSFIDNEDFSAIIKKSSSSGAKGTGDKNQNGVTDNQNNDFNPLYAPIDQLRNHGFGVAEDGTDD